MYRLRREEVEQKFEITMENRKKTLNEYLGLFHKELEENTMLIEQYKEEMPLLQTALVEERMISQASTDRIIMRAVMQISSYRVRDIRDKGWVCGTYMMKLKKRFLVFLIFLFTEEELAELIQCCIEKKELSSYQEDILLILLHNTPKTLVHVMLSKISVKK